MLSHVGEEMYEGLKAAFNTQANFGTQLWFISQKVIGRLCLTPPVLFETVFLKMKTIISHKCHGNEVAACSSPSVVLTKVEKQVVFLH